MAWTLTGSLEEYLAVAGGFLRSRPVHNTIQLVALDALRVRGPSAFLRRRSAGRNRPAR